MSPKASAVISTCGQYRYHLTRPPIAPYPLYCPAPFVMLNPSTADAAIDDATIRRCRGFAERWGNDGIIVVNVYALRSTDPKALNRHADPYGPENDDWLRKIGRFHESVVVAWGTKAAPGDVDRAVEKLTQGGARLMCLGTTKHGHPRHPLYVRADQPLVPWNRSTSGPEA